jgi:SAM-dependent methyltransferase
VTEGPPRIFNRRAYRARRARAAQAGGDAFLADMAAEALADRISAVNRNFLSALDLGSRGGNFAALTPLARTWVHASASGDFAPGAIKVRADDEALPLADSAFDLVTSVLGLHAVNDLPGTLVQTRRVLKPDGLFMAAMFGGETLVELRHSFAAAESEIRGGISPRVFPFGDVRDLGGLLQRAGFTLPVSDSEKTVVRYRDLTTLFSDLRSLGETNALAERASGLQRRDVMAAALKHYAENFSDPDGRFRATFEIVYLTGWAPHESQQKPLKPGSAKMRLSDALGTEERATGEKPGG